jgi:hypothetical protein
MCVCTNMVREFLRRLALDLVDITRIMATDEAGFLILFTASYMWTRIIIWLVLAIGPYGACMYLDCVFRAIEYFVSLFTGRVVIFA